MKRVFRPPVGLEESFVDLVRSLEFGDQFIDGETIINTSVPREVQPKQEVQQSVDGGTSTTTSVPQEVQPKEEVEQSVDGQTSAATNGAKELQLKQEVQQSINDDTSTTTSVPQEVQSEQEVEHFQTEAASDVQLTDNHRRCEKITQRPDWQAVFGTLNYSTGIHKIRLKLEKGSFDIVLGICSRNKQPTGPYFYDKPTTHGWFINGYVVKNGQNPRPGWFQVYHDEILEFIINCTEQSLSIRNEQSEKQDSMQVNIAEAPFPWCLLVLLHYKTNRVSLV